jgi:hypothetical protein
MTVQGSSLTTTIGQPVTANLAAGMAAGALDRWRNKMEFIVLEQPIHGKLSKYVTDEPTIVYTPSKGYSGSDFFTFRLRVGYTNSTPATVAIMILSQAEHMEQTANANTTTMEKGNSSNNSPTNGPSKFSRATSSTTSSYTCTNTYEGPTLHKTTMH